MQRSATILALRLVLAAGVASCATDDSPEPPERVDAHVPPEDLAEPAGPQRVRTDGVEIAFRAFGGSAGAPVLFIQGVGGTMPDEPDGFLHHLVERGYRVIAFDNRDVGASTRLDHAGAPDLERIGAALAAGEPAPLPYTLREMAGDALAVLDALAIDRAHIIGGSAGGMIAQIIAAEHPDRVASLTLISSTNNNPELPPGTDSQQQEGIPANLMRQGLAAAFAGDLRDVDAAITAPTLIIHGTADEVFPPAHGRHLAASIPGADLEIMEGMGHVPEEAHAEEIGRLIGAMIDQSR